MEGSTLMLARKKWLAIFRCFAVLAWLWLLVAIPSLTNASCDFEMWLILSGSGFLLGLAWFLVTCLSLNSLHTRKALRWCLAVPITGLIALFLACTDKDLALRVALSEESLQAGALDLISAADHGHFPRQLGLFWVNRAAEIDGAVFFFTSQSFIDQQGVAYIPTGKRVPSRFRINSHLFGPWYSFNWMF